MTTLAEETSISNVALGKAFRSAHIPMPGLGYWAKLAAGKKVARPQLSEPHLGTARFVYIPGTLTRRMEARIEGAPGEREVAWESTDLLRERFVSLLPKLTLAGGSSWHCEPVKRLMDKDARRREKQKASYPLRQWMNPPMFDSPVQNRRLKFIDALAYACERVSGWLSLQDDDATAIVIHIGSGWTTAELTERDGSFKFALMAWDNPKVSYGQWDDVDRGKIAGTIKSIIVKAAEGAWVGAVERHAERKAHRIQEHAKMEEMRRAAKAAEERHILEAEKLELERAVQALTQAARGADDASLIRKFVADVVTRLAPDIPRDQLDAWSRWAMRVADTVDPWKNGEVLRVVQTRSNIKPPG